MITKVICEEIGKVLTNKILLAGVNDTSLSGNNWRFPRYMLIWQIFNYYSEEQSLVIQ